MPSFKTDKSRPHIWRRTVQGQSNGMLNVVIPKTNYVSDARLPERQRERAELILVERPRK